jgi:hypothetical protein
MPMRELQIVCGQKKCVHNRGGSCYSRLVILKVFSDVVSPDRLRCVGYNEPVMSGDSEPPAPKPPECKT